MPDTTHLEARIPDGLGNPAEDDRRHQAAVTAQRLRSAAKVVVDALAGGDEGAARRFLHSLEHDLAADVDPWRLVEHAVTLTLRRTGITVHANR